MLIRCVMKDWLPLQPWRVCLIRHVAAKVRFFRGDESANTCLHCPQVTDLITEPNNTAEVGTMNEKSERYGTCKDCKTPDSFLFSEKRCRQCHYDARDGKEPGSTVLARRAAQAEKASKPKRGKKGNEKSVMTAHEDGRKTITSSCTFKVTTGNVAAKEAEPVCDHVIGLDTQPLTGITAPFRPGEIIEHKNEDCSDLTLFSFCPKCGKKLKLTRSTVAILHHTIFREAEEG